MGITERVERMLVRVQSPSGSVSAELHGNDDVRVWFAPGFYQRADRHEMQTQLEQAARLLWAARVTEYQRILSDEYEQPMAERSPVGRLDTEFSQRREALVAQGESDDGHIAITVRGMRDWRVELTADALRALREDEFTAGVVFAARKLIADQLAKILQLRVSTYDPGLTLRFAA